MMNGRKCPFTASQFQELKNQALIYKYISAGMHIPSELILNMKNSHTYPSMGWSCYQHHRRTDDPEPGRCRRTDGKKWRCSKGVNPGSKYCEKHIHRGRNRSRKPVEAISHTTTFPSSHHPHLSISQPEANHHQIMYPYPQNIGNHFHPETFNEQKDYRYGHVSEYAFLSPRGTEEGSPLEFKPLEMRLLKEEDEQQQQQQQEHCFVMGAELRLEKPVKEEKVDEKEEVAQPPLHLFFDEWPQKATQLSLSTPIAYQ